MKNPAAGFEEAIRIHFYMKRHELRTMANAWVAEAEEREERDSRRREKLERDRYDTDSLYIQCVARTMYTEI
jgi:hypothetical protein